MEDSGYQVTYDSDQGGMSVIYDITNTFLDPVIKKNFFPEGFLSEKGYDRVDSDWANMPQDMLDNIGSFLATNIPIMVCLILGLILPIISAIVGCCFCCRKRGEGSGEGGVKRQCVSFILFLELLVAGLGCMWFFLGANTCQLGIDAIPQKVENILHDGDLYMNNTIDELETFLEDKFGEVLDGFQADTEQNFTEFVQKLKEDIQFDDIKSTANSFVDLVRTYENNVTKTVDSAQANFQNISSTINDVETMINSALCQTDPTNPICAAVQEAKELIAAIPTSLTEVSLPDLPDGAAGTLSTIAGILDSVDQQIDGLNIGEYFPNVTDGIKEELSAALQDLIDPISSIQDDIFRKKGQNIVDFLKNIKTQYFPLFNISALVLGSLLVLILSLVMLGLLCGCCARQGGGNANFGSSLMFSATSFFFLLAVLLFLLCFVFFLVGATTQKVLCNTLDQPAGSELVQAANPILTSLMKTLYGREDSDNISFDLADIISDLQRGRALYPTLQLDLVFDVNNLTDWRNTFNIEELLSGVRDDVKTLIDEIVNTDLDESAVKAMAVDIDSLLNEHLPAFLDEEINDAIKKAADRIETIQDMAQGQENIPADLLEKLETMISSFSQLTENVVSLQSVLNNTIHQFGDGNKFSLADVVRDTFGLVNAAFRLIPDRILEFLDTVIASLYPVVDTYVADTILAAEQDIGQTWPVGNIYNATYNDVCLEIVAPFNSVWSGLGWCLLFILFPITLAVSSLRAILGTRARPNRAERAVSMTELPVRVPPGDYNARGKPGGPGRGEQLELKAPPAYQQHWARQQQYRPSAPPNNNYY